MPLDQARRGFPAPTGVADQVEVLAGVAFGEPVVVVPAAAAVAIGAGVGADAGQFGEGGDAGIPAGLLVSTRRRGRRELRRASRMTLGSLDSVVARVRMVRWTSSRGNSCG